MWSKGNHLWNNRQAMKRIDLYVQHLQKHNADGLVLASNQPARFRFAEGERKTNNAVDHAQIVQLVQEAAPPELITQLRTAGKAEFELNSGGTNVGVQVTANSPREWEVQIHAGGLSAAPAASAPSGGPSHAPAPSMPAKAATAPPQPSVKPAATSASNYQAVSGEPGLNRYLRAMADLGGSDLHMTSGAPAMVRVHGDMRPLFGDRPIPAEEMEKLLLEIAPARNRQEFADKWDTDFAHTIEGLSRFRANLFMDRIGVGGVFRQIPYEILTAKQLGVPPKVLDLCWLTKGLVLVTGPTGSGKSTTLAALVDFINKNRSDHIITIEDPIEFVHQNQKCLVNQREVGTHTKSFKNALRAALREDPDIVLVGEMRDLETIAIAIETAETGHLVFGTLHTTSAMSTVDRVIDQFPADRQEQIRVMLSESLRGVIAQVLCKKKGGGRIAAHEILIANNAVSNVIREGKTYQLASVMQTGKKQGMQTMNDRLFELVRDGLVDPDEAYMKSNDKNSFKEVLKRNNIQITVIED